MFGLARLLQLTDDINDLLCDKNSRRRPVFGRRPSGPAKMWVEELEERLVPTLLGQQLFPSDNPWNQNIANAPVAANSAAIIAHIGTSTRLTPNWGADNSASSNPLYGMPINIVHGNSTATVNVLIDNYPGESDVTPVPIPQNAVLEGDFQNRPNPNGAGYGENGTLHQRGDSHLIVWDEDHNIAYELYGVSRPNDPNLFPNRSNVELPKLDTFWHAAQETVWNMNTNTFRTLGATSADAAGLSILAGLARPDEGLPVSQGGQGVINHALRVTLPGGEINPQYVYPASHIVGVSQGADHLPLGGRLRLANTPTINQLISNMPPESQILARAMQQYGLIVADVGTAMYVSGASASVDANNHINFTWNLSDIFASNGLEALNAGDFQVVDLTPVVTGLSASSAAPGSTVTITGQNFSGAAGHLAVFFGNTASITVNVVSDTQITAVVPSGSGTVDVTIQSGVNEIDTISGNPNANVHAPIFGYGTSATSAADKITFNNGTVSLQSIIVTPGNPSVALGNSPAFTATGKFSDNSTQTLTTGITWSSSNSAVATINGSGTATTLAAGMTTIMASVSGISGSTTLTVTAVSALPTVSGVSPASGPAAGGTTVTITGTNFTGATRVSFGGTAATGFHVNSTTSLTATTPAGSAGQSVDITVTTAAGTSATNESDRFSFTASTFPPPAHLHATPGNGSVTFSFDPVTAPVDYYPYAQLINGTLYPIYVGFSNPFTITANNQGPLVNGQTYTFEVAITYSGNHTSAWSDPITVTVGGTGSAPTVTTQPSNVTATAGQTVSFSAAASGSPSPTVQWQVSHNGGAFTNITGATSTTLSFAADTSQTGNKYRAVFTNGSGSATTSTATLTVNAGAQAPTITLNPQNQSVTAGSTVTLTAGASGSPTPTVQWQVSTGGAFVNISGATATTYTFAATAGQNGNQFRAVFTNSAGQAITSAATLTTTTTTGIVVGPGQQLVVGAGQTVTGVTVLAGGDLLVLAGGTDNGSVLNGGVETVEAGGKSIGTTVTGEGDLEVFGQGINLILDEGYINVDAGGTVNGTTINGEIMYVSGGGTANNTTINAGGSTTVIAGGVVNGTILNGSEEFVRSGAVSNGTTANNGSTEYVFAGGLSNNLTLNNGGAATMLGNVNGATINVGGTLTVFDGGAATGAILDKGLLAFSLSATNTFTGQLTGNGGLNVAGTGKLVVANALNNLAVQIGSSSSLELESTSNAVITFGYQSTLRLDDSQGFTGSLALTPGYLDAIDLGDFPFSAGVTSASNVENAAHTQGVLTLSEGPSGPSLRLTLLGNFNPGAITASADGVASTQIPHPGTLIRGF
jgi:autotransporter passenger strand-loop-strand repeat protein